VRESFVEDKFKARIKQEGGHCFKLRFIARVGAPDRLVLLKKWHCLVELKRPKKYAEEHQTRLHKLLIWAGFKVFVVNSIEGIEDVITEYRRDSERA